MGEWKNIGDINPKHGACMVRDLRIENDAFLCDVILVIPETDVGGSDRIFDISAGSMYLARDKWGDALKACGSRIDKDGNILTGVTGHEERIAPGSESYLAALCYATSAYCGPEYESSTLVGIGIPTPFDGPPKFNGEVILYPQGTSLWSIMKSVTDGFDYEVDGVPVEEATALDLWDGPYTGTPRSIGKMSDLTKIKAFRDLGVDEQGNPKVWRHEYVLPDWTVREVEFSAHEDHSLFYEGKEYHPADTVWVGPEEEDLCELWESLYEDNRPQLVNDDVSLDI